ncbi:hypothetical protein L286_17175 [Sphingobium sp. HDIP04]|nr:hypothetical protein L286_17175 [Sphingobium sp. HDIP04]
MWEALLQAILLNGTAWLARSLISCLPALTFPQPQRLVLQLWLTTVL